MSIRRNRGFLKRQADAQRSLLDGSQQGTLRVATPYKVTAGRRGVLAAGGNADAGAHLHLTAQPAAAVAAGGTYNVSWDGQDASHPAAGYAETALTLPVVAVPVVVAGYYDLQTVVRWTTALAWSIELVRTRDSVETVVWPPAVLPQTAAFTDTVGAVHVLAVELLAGDTITARIANDSGAGGTVDAAHLSLSLVDRSRGVVTNPPTGFYVAVGGGATTGTVQVATSPDGVTWTERTTPFAGQLLSVTHNGSIYAAGNSTSPGEIGTSPDGITWTQRTNPFTGGINDIAWGGGLFVAVGGSGELATSPDGITWTARTSGFGTAQIMAVDYDETAALFVAAGASGQLATSPDGINWTARTSGFGTSTIEKVAHGSGLWVAVAFGKIGTSPDGITWTQRTHPLNTAIRAVSYGDGVYIAGAHAGRLATSPDGITWTERTTGLSGGIYGSSWAAGLFVVGTDAGELATSPDGVAWTVRTSPFPATSSKVYEIVGVTT